MYFGGFGCNFLDAFRGRGGSCSNNFSSCNRPCGFAHCTHNCNLCKKHSCECNAHQHCPHSHCPPCPHSHCPHPHCPPCPPIPPYPPLPPIPPVPPQPQIGFGSCYAEAVGGEQTVLNGGSFVFDVEAVDIDGSGISLNSTGDTFEITRAGLYHIEWSLSMDAGMQPIIVGLLENGGAASAMSHYSGRGSLSSGAVINITKDQLPYAISLHNFGGSLSLQQSASVQNTALSMRIVRFADRAN